MLKRKLYRQIYFTIVASLIAVVVVSSVVWNIAGRDRLEKQIFDVTSKLVYLALPPAALPPDAQQEAIERIAEEVGVDISLFDADRALVGASGVPSPPPRGDPGRNGWHRMRGGPGWALNMPDGRWVVADLGRNRHGRPLIGLLVYLASIALVVGLAAYPFVRRLTGRIERLQTGVERIGAGDLSARVEVEGKDEVAALAESFNAAAEKVEKLVASHRMLLANASHELRTPLSRIRLGIEMIKKGERARVTALEQDIAELDELVDEILLMSRLNTGTAPRQFEAIDLVALAAEECTRYDACEVSGAASDVTGDPVLLRRMLRNLVENAYRHGKPPVEVEVGETPESLTVTVRDHGKGIPESDWEKVFRPFQRGAGNQNVKGYGLGLPLVRQIAEAHGGRVEILAGDGMAVRVWLAARRPKDGRSGIPA